MKEQDTTQTPQQHATQTPKSDLVANLLRDRLATKLSEDELTTLIKEVMLASSQERMQAFPSGENIYKLKSSIDYIEYKCAQIERTLRAADRRMRLRRGRYFRDRSPLMSFGDLSL
jgi:hypothetical protein